MSIQILKLENCFNFSQFIIYFQLYLFHFVTVPCLSQRKTSERIPGQVEFSCPEEFGYYPHPNDCTQYYVCVFGGAVLESCTGGLMYRSVKRC